MFLVIRSLGVVPRRFASSLRMASLPPRSSGVAVRWEGEPTHTLDLGAEWNVMSMKMVVVTCPI